LRQREDTISHHVRVSQKARSPSWVIRQNSRRVCVRGGEANHPCVGLKRDATARKAPTKR
jgi:hypothetical protein